MGNSYAQSEERAQEVGRQRVRDEQALAAKKAREDPNFDPDWNKREPEWHANFVKNFLPAVSTVAGIIAPPGVKQAIQAGVHGFQYIHDQGKAAEARERQTAADAAAGGAGGSLATDTGGQESKTLSGEDVKRLAGGGRIITYPDLDKIKTWDELIDNPKRAAIILFCVESPTEGHWICAFEGPDGTHVFDPIGMALDAERNRISMEKRRELGETDPELRRLVMMSGAPVHVSKVHFQEDAPGVNTCGRWVGLRLQKSKLTDAQFGAFVKEGIARMGKGTTPDEWVVAQTAAINSSPGYQPPESRASSGPSSAQPPSAGAGDTFQASAVVGGSACDIDSSDLCGGVLGETTRNNTPDSSGIRERILMRPARFLSEGVVLPRGTRLHVSTRVIDREGRTRWAIAQSHPELGQFEIPDAYHMDPADFPAVVDLSSEDEEDALEGSGYPHVPPLIKSPPPRISKLLLARKRAAMQAAHVARGVHPALLNPVEMRGGALTGKRGREADSNVLQFWSRSADPAARFFSNFSHAPFDFEGQPFTSVEHAYQFHNARNMSMGMPGARTVHGSLQDAMRRVPPDEHGGIQGGLAAKKFMTKGNFLELAATYGFGTKRAAGAHYDAAKARFRSINTKLMRDIVRARFTQDPRSREALLATGDKLLSHFDRMGGHWGASRPGDPSSGADTSGKILMDVRRELRAHAAPPAAADDYADYADAETVALDSDDGEE